MRINAWVALLGLAVTATSAFGAPWPCTGFERPSTGTTYYDTGSPSVNHALMNNTGQMPVNYTSTPYTELGFSAYYTNTRNGVGLTDGDAAGVTAATGVVGYWPEGVHGYEISDPDGKMTVTLDTIPLGSGPAAVHLELFVRPTEWEADDHIRIWVAVPGGGQLDLLNTTGSDIDYLGIEGSWLSLGRDLGGYASASLMFELDGDADSEAMFIDAIQFVPLPGTLVLLGPGVLLMRTRRRRRA